MTLGRLEDCPFCGHSGGLPLTVMEGHIVRMRCPACDDVYEMTTQKLTRPNQ
jgi:transcription elongation factor Elf1